MGWFADVWQAYKRQRHLSQLVQKICNLAEQAYPKELGVELLRFSYSDSGQAHRQLLVEFLGRLSEQEMQTLFARQWLWHRHMSGSYLGIRSRYELHSRLKGSWITSGLTIAILVTADRYNTVTSRAIFQKIKPYIGDDQVQALWPAWGSAYWKHDQDFSMLMLALVMCQEDQSPPLNWLLDHPCARITKEQWQWVCDTVPVEKFAAEVHQKVSALIEKEQLAYDVPVIVESPVSSTKGRQRL